jgi:tetrapyrrole methylase family protein/MazG family protein/ATP diphosphatase
MAQEKTSAINSIETLLNIMAKLRSPDGGCPWDLEQNFRTIAPYTIEEAYEVADAIERDDLRALKEELGDLLFQTVFHARMAAERGAFDFYDVVAAINEKMVRRHPHVFAEGAARTADEQTRAWEAQKAEERAAKGVDSLLADVPVGLPGMTRAVKLQKRAARVGFDWTNVEDVLAKLEEEVRELAGAVENKDPDAIEDEFGDLLFVIANVARHLSVDPESAVRRTNEKFIRRFHHIERSLRNSGRDIAAASLEEMEALWVEAKAREKSNPDRSADA